MLPPLTTRKHVFIIDLNDPSETCGKRRDVPLESCLLSPFSSSQLPRGRQPCAGRSLEAIARRGLQRILNAR